MSTPTHTNTLTGRIVEIRQRIADEFTDQVGAALLGDPRLARRIEPFRLDLVRASAVIDPDEAFPVHDDPAVEVTVEVVVFDPLGAPHRATLVDERFSLGDAIAWLRAELDQVHDSAALDEVSDHRLGADIAEAIFVVAQRRQGLVRAHDELVDAVTEFVDGLRIDLAGQDVVDEFVDHVTERLAADLDTGADPADLDGAVFFAANRVLSARVEFLGVDEALAAFRLVLTDEFGILDDPADEVVRISTD